MDQTKLYKNLSDTPGVYLMKDAKGGILYVGKAGNLKRRVSSYFNRPPSFAQGLRTGKHDSRIQKMVSLINDIEIRQTDTAIEALILESYLIKKLQPPFNVREKDDKSFLYVEITKDKFPRVLLVRGKDKGGASAFGPFTSATSIREALRILRKIFPWSIHLSEQKFTRPCFEYELGICPGTCVGAISQKDYKKNITKLKLFFEGKKERVLRSLEKEMDAAAKKQEYEEAAKIRGRIFALKHIQDVALIKESEFDDTEKKPQSGRIEGYDISNISGDSATGSMVVFTDGEPDKGQYRKFKIQYFAEPNPARRSSDLRSGGGDTGMMKEVLRRRFNNSWPLPNLILIDGGAGQINAAKKILEEFGLRIPIIGIVKGPERKRNDFIGFVPKGVDKKVLIRVRDEAHRFAITYHKRLRGIKFLQ